MNHWRKKASLALIAMFAALSIASPATGRDYVSISGSSTVLPFAAAAAEAFKRQHPRYKTPVVESGGSSAGLKLFCAGVGPQTIDIANASRRIKKKELDVCHAHGVKPVIELRIGYDGIVFASDIDAAPMNFSLKDLFLGMAAQVPINGKLATNPYRTWRDINSSYPNIDILAFIPGEKHGTRDVFESIVMGGGCERVEGLKELVGGDETAFKAFCKKVRKDGRVVDIDGDYTVTLARIQSAVGAIGVFGFGFYDLNQDRIRVATIDGKAPTFESISDGTWPVARPLYLYVKGQHFDAITGLKDYARFFMSDAFIGDDGLASELGLIPAPSKERTLYRKNLSTETDLTM